MRERVFFNEQFVGVYEHKAVDVCHFCQRENVFEIVHDPNIVFVFNYIPKGRVGLVSQGSDGNVVHWIAKDYIHILKERKQKECCIR